MVILQPVIDSIRWTLRVVVLLLLKLSRALTNAIFVLIAFSHESSFSFLTSTFRQNLTLPIFKFSCFFVVLFDSSVFALNIVWGITQHCLIWLHCVCIILALKKLNNFKSPTPCLQANQNHFLRDQFSH